MRPRCSDIPDAIGVVKIVNGLNRGFDIGNNPTGASTGFTIACAANPGVQDIDHEVRRFAHKVEAGAEYGITQPVFDLRLLEKFLRAIEGFRIPIVAGIWPLTSLRNAEFMRNDLKVAVPDEIMERMAAQTTKESSAARRAEDCAGDAGKRSRRSTGCAGQRSFRQVWRRSRGVGTARGGLMASFEEQLAELEKVVEQLERGDLPQDENVALFERGVELSRACKAKRLVRCGEPHQCAD